VDDYTPPGAELDAGRRPRLEPGVPPA